MERSLKIRKPADHWSNRMREKLLRLRDGSQCLPAYTPYSLLSINRFIEALASARLDGTYLRRLNMIAKTPLLIIDDFSRQPLNRDMRLTLLQILEDRFAKGAAIVTSQLPVNKWYEYINEPTLADAICDRMTSNAHKIELKRESLRKNKNN